jgi:tetratricopeptide (TPR) repeat protein
MLAGERSISLDVARATECFDRVLELLPPNHPDRASALFWKAIAAQDAGRYEEAEELYRRSIEAFREGGDRIGEGMSLNRLSNVLWERGAYAESREHLEESVEILAAEPPGPELAACYASSASARILVGAFDEAIELSERALELARRLDAGASSAG